MYSICIIYIYNIHMLRRWIAHLYLDMPTGGVLFQHGYIPKCFTTKLTERTPHTLCHQMDGFEPSFVTYLASYFLSIDRQAWVQTCIWYLSTQQEALLTYSAKVFDDFMNFQSHSSQLRTSTRFNFRNLHGVIPFHQPRPRESLRYCDQISLNTNRVLG